MFLWVQARDESWSEHHWEERKIGFLNVRCELALNPEQHSSLHSQLVLKLIESTHMSLPIISAFFCPITTPGPCEITRTHPLLSDFGPEI